MKCTKFRKYYFHLNNWKIIQFLLPIIASQKHPHISQWHRALVRMVKSHFHLFSHRNYIRKVIDIYPILQQQYKREFSIFIQMNFIREL